MTNITDKETRDKAIVALWAVGLTGKEIAKVLGTTRSAILGRVNRMRSRGVELEARDPNGDKKNSGKVRRNDNKKKPEATVTTSAPPKKVPRYIEVNGMQLFLFNEPKETQKAGPVDILGLTSTMCRYIVKTARDNSGTTLYCGEEATKRHYCEEHFRLCYVPVKDYRR